MNVAVTAIAGPQWVNTTRGAGLGELRSYPGGVIRIPSTAMPPVLFHEMVPHSAKVCPAAALLMAEICQQGAGMCR